MAVAVGLTAAAVLALAVGAIAILPGVARVVRRARSLERIATEHKAGLQTLGRRLTELRAENEVLLKPVRRALRWARHPLVVALWSSYRIRRRRRLFSATPDRMSRPAAPPPLSVDERRELRPPLGQLSG